MAIDEAAILDTKYAYDVAVSEARWREDYAQWEDEKTYRQDKYTQDVAYRNRQIQYDVAREERRYEHDIDLAYASIAKTRDTARELVVTSRKEKAEAEIASQQEERKTREAMSIATINAAAFGSGRSTSTMLRQLGVEGAEKTAGIDLMGEMQEAIRSQQMSGLSTDAQAAIDTVTPYLTPLTPKTVITPIDYRPPIYIRPLEPNLEKFVLGGEDEYLAASPEAINLEPIPSPTVAPAAPAPAPAPTVAPAPVVDTYKRWDTNLMYDRP